MMIMVVMLMCGCSFIAMSGSAAEFISAAEPTDMAWYKTEIAMQRSLAWRVNERHGVQTK